MLTIDLTFLQNLGAYLQWLGTQHPLYAMWALFLYGGWIPVFYVLVWGGLRIWLDWRQGKYAQTIDYTVLAIDIPKGNEQSPKAVEHIFSHLSGAKSSINFKEKWLEGKYDPSLSLEIISLEGYIQFLVRTPLKFRNLVEAAFFSQYPDAEIIEVEDYTKDVPHNYPNEEYNWFGGEIVLRKPSPYPIRTYPQFEHPLSGEFKDPMANFLESMGKMSKGEQFWIQIMLIPASDSWIKEGEQIVDKLIGRKREAKPGLIEKGLEIPGKLVEEVVEQILGGGDELPKKPEKKEADRFTMFSMTPGEAKVLEAIQYKIAKVGFRAKIRWIYYAKKEVFNVGNIYGHMRGFMKQYSSLNLNSLSSYPETLTKGDYFWQKWWLPQKKRNIINRYVSRDIVAGAPICVFNIEELATLYHFPAKEVKAPLIKKAEAKRAEPPFGLPTK